MIDGETLTNRRTAAASALASRHLSRPDSRTLLLIVTGRLASYLAVGRVLTLMCAFRRGCPL